MAIRTTDAAVQGIIDHDSTISLTPFIEVASNLVDRTCVSSGYSSATLELIERWLSAHFYHIRDKVTASEQAGTVLRSFQHRVDLGLNVTMYGQNAMRIDTAGNLASLDKKLTLGLAAPGVVWLGTGNSDGDDISGD